ncbi:hypothetical protein ARTHRO9AX_180733 [Arthrobacter sp. 9AX]|nr:hypothetical protein ARTHRO9AX_180733 [Arthrobacter sp. 9AX]
MTTTTRAKPSTPNGPTLPSPSSAPCSTAKGMWYRSPKAVSPALAWRRLPFRIGHGALLLPRISIGQKGSECPTTAKPPPPVRFASPSWAQDRPESTLRTSSPNPAA